MRPAVYLTLCAALATAGISACTPAFEDGDDCQNGVDDDDDGLVDCDDPSCKLLPACGLCGNGVLDPGEICDDGNLVEGDGCNSRCLEENCPNGVVDPGEECDDGNLIPGDGCNAACRFDRCGDGVLERDTEQCEDGNHADGDGCSHDCRAEPIPLCGNGRVDFDPETFVQLEECDDGNNTSGDGCSSSCHFERCGDGITEPTLGEECDDGNAGAGDGCSPQCRRE